MLLLQGPELPRVLSCGHSYCLPCIMLQSASADLACTSCGHQSPHSDVRLNFALADLSLSKESLTLEDAIETLPLTCQICADPFMTDHTPFVLPCGHTFCQACIGNLRHTGDNKICPNRCDRTEGVIVVNRALVTLVENLHLQFGYPKMEVTEEPPETRVREPSEDGLHYLRQFFSQPPPLPPPPPRYLISTFYTYLACLNAGAIFVSIVEKSCNRLKPWLLLFAAMLVLTPVTTQFIIHRQRTVFKFLRSCIGLVFVFILAFVLYKTWLNLPSDCSVGDPVWIVCTIAGAVHITLYCLHVAFEILFCCHQDRRLAYIVHLYIP
eukprot:NODE_2986_length_1052_cov_15.929730_g2847_i0.p1 GENE.NODE_2986_length_1052_cov_15.929730_g2847_i0~~NODE_2986_length_1052_cov_15.929730_g2847_i0.p1  ORF type:complete len:346 (-),score=53.68 NODE_2986_length_1052_cov_15.929730_g2847_i0:13-984(-)